MGHSGWPGTLLPIILELTLLKRCWSTITILLNEKPKGITTHIDKKALLEMLKGLSKEERME